MANNRQLRTGRVSQRIEPNLDARLKLASLKLGTKRADIVRAALVAFLEAHEKTPA